MGKQNKKSSTSFLVQGSILAIASIVSRIIGLIYRIPLTNIIGDTGNDYYGTAFQIYNILLIISSYSLPLAVSKLVSANYSQGRRHNVYRILKCALIFGVCTGTVAALILLFGAEFITGTLMKTPMSVFAVRVLIPVLLIVAVLGVMRGFFQGLGTMMPSATSQILEQIANASSVYGQRMYWLIMVQRLEHCLVMLIIIPQHTEQQEERLVLRSEHWLHYYSVPLYWLYICVRSNAVCTESGKETLIPMARYFICLS